MLAPFAALPNSTVAPGRTPPAGPAPGHLPPADDSSEVAAALPAGDLPVGVCAHCGDPLGRDTVAGEVAHASLAFCCGACRTVYAILHEHGLAAFYTGLERTRVRGRTGGDASDYGYLDEASTLERVATYFDGRTARLELEAPAIHCASCLWLLERLPRLCPAVRRSRVDLLARRITLVVDTELGPVSEVLAWLHRLGYPPRLQLDRLRPEAVAAGRPLRDATRTYPHAEAVADGDEGLGWRIGLAGFAAGNVMMMAFPEYLGMSTADLAHWRPWFGGLSLALAMPVFVLSAGRYLSGAWRGLRFRQLNVDLPIALGMLAMLGHSAYEIISGTGPGYLDSLLGLIFFLLLGRWFQRQTHRRLAFDRDYRSYLPLAARVSHAGKCVAVPLDALRAGDRVEVSDGELVPADGYLRGGTAALDRSYLTGEDAPQAVAPGARVQAGCRQCGDTIVVELSGRVDASYLARLWAENGGRASPRPAGSRVFDAVGRQFAVWTLVLAAGTLAYWWPQDAGLALRAATAVLIVACPCAASLALPFVYGRISAIAARHGLALREALVVERFAEVDASAFDKTGTLSDRSAMGVAEVLPVPPAWRQVVGALAARSTHPASAALLRCLGREACAHEAAPAHAAALGDVVERVGSGVEATWSSGGVATRHGVRLGRPAWVSSGGQVSGSANLAFAVDGVVVASFRVQSPVRAGVAALLAFAKTRGPVALVSGDGDQERDRWAALFGLGGGQVRARAERPDEAGVSAAGFGERRGASRDVSTAGRKASASGFGDSRGGLHDAGAANDAVGAADDFADCAGGLYFRQTPSAKKRLLEGWAAAGWRVLYLGDGLNDAGALQAAHVGVAVAEERGGFNPACDAVLAAEAVPGFAALWRFVGRGRALVAGALVLAVAYNVTGLTFAVLGRLEPVVAAILMPLSSLTVVGYAWASTWWASRGLRPNTPEKALTKPPEGREA